MTDRMDEQRTDSGERARCAGGDESVAAVVVTYEPGVGFLRNVSALRQQLHRLIVVDNGSAAKKVEELRAAAQRMAFDLIENGSNLGIAAALNRGVERALTLGAGWIFLFDQDSCVTPGFAEAMVQAYIASPWGDRLKILTPQYRAAETGAVLPAIRAKQGIAVAWTSGSLLRAETLRGFGPFREELFIDEVDHEYSLRLRQSGMVLDQTPAATLLHALGSPTEHTLFGKKFCSTNYSPVRRYYQERNKVWMARHFGRSFPGFILRRFRMSATDFAKILIFEENRWRKARFFLRGWIDGLRGKTGRLADPAAGE